MDEYQTQLNNLLTTIETLSNYACESCGKWEPDEDGSNFCCESFFFTIMVMAKEAKGWAYITATTNQ